MLNYDGIEDNMEQQLFPVVSSHMNYYAERTGMTSSTRYYSVVVFQRTVVHFPSRVRACFVVPDNPITLGFNPLTLTSITVKQ